VTYSRRPAEKTSVLLDSLTPDVHTACKLWIPIPSDSLGASYSSGIGLGCTGVATIKFFKSVPKSPLIHLDPLLHCNAVYTAFNQINRRNFCNKQ